MPTWIYLVFWSLALAAVLFSQWYFILSTRRNSTRPASAGSVSARLSEMDQEIALLKSSVDGLYSTLRKLRGRESMRSLHDKDPLVSEQISQQADVEAERQRLRRAAGIIRASPG